jgi:hypothetical protein
MFLKLGLNYSSLDLNFRAKLVKEILTNILAQTSQLNVGELGFCFDKYWNSSNVLFEGLEPVGIEDWGIEDVFSVFGLEVEYSSNWEEF